MHGESRETMGGEGYLFLVRTGEMPDRLDRVDNRVDIWHCAVGASACRTSGCPGERAV